jgi:hypothetical protein
LFGVFSTKSIHIERELIISIKHENNSQADLLEISVNQPESIDIALSTINTTEVFVDNNLDIQEPEDLNSVTGEALVYVAKRTIEEARKENSVLKPESLDIEAAIEAVIVFGINKECVGVNPIVQLEQSGLGKEITDAVSTLHKQNAKLPSGEDVAEKVGEMLDVPEVLYRGERRYLNNIDQIGNQSLSTKGYERISNQGGRVYLARDIEYARAYSVGTDGVIFYDNKLTKDEIPIGVVYKINNKNNIIKAIPDGEPVPDISELGDIAGKYREFTSSEIPHELCEVVELQIMDDYKQPSGHTRSDFRQVLESFTVDSQGQLNDVIKSVKIRIDELDAQR